MSYSITKCKCECMCVDQQLIINDLIISKVKLCEEVLTMKEELERLKTEKKVLDEKIFDLEHQIHIKKAHIFCISQGINARQHNLT